MGIWYIILCLLTANFGYKVHYVPFNLGYTIYIGENFRVFWVFSSAYTGIPLLPLADPGGLFNMHFKKFLNTSTK